MMTKVPVKQANVIWYKDLEDLIKTHIGIEVDIQGGELGQDTYLQSFESISDTLDEYDREAISLYLEEFTKCNTADVDIDAFLKILVHKGILPTGNYIVTIWW